MLENLGVYSYLSLIYASFVAFGILKKDTPTLALSDAEDEVVP